MTSADPEQAISLLELNRRVIRSLTAAPGLTNVWVTGETSDFRVAGGHCYMELIQKDDNGQPLAKCRAVIWSSTYTGLSRAFTEATGTALKSDIKIMVRASVNYHAYYGMSLVISDINPDYTVGDLVRKRNAILTRLRNEGIIDLNRSLPWTPTPQRIAIISASGAAGYGDFVSHLHLNPMRLRFETTLFQAAMQGEHTVHAVIGALNTIMERVDDFDCVVIIRGGGAVADLASFDDYELACNVAQFPLPVIVGIGHERDNTVLDFVANTRVKTPTAAAEALLSRLGTAYASISTLGQNILSTVRDSVAGRRQQLAYIHGLLPALTLNVVERNRRHVDTHASEAITSAATTALRMRRQRLDALAELLDTLSPEATLRRGYSITRINGHALTDSSAIPKGAVLTTTFAKGPDIESVYNAGDD